MLAKISILIVPWQAVTVMKPHFSWEKRSHNEC